jgi:WD40 repeat protein
MASGIDRITTWIRVSLRDVVRRVDALWGYDVFIAHRRADAAKYAEALHEKLSAEKISSFIDRVVYGPGDSLLVATRQHVAKSSLFVLVGSPELLIPRHPVDWIEREIDTFLNSHEANPKILLVDFDSCVAKALALPAAAGAPPHPILGNLAPFLRISESLPALSLPPSEDVLAGIRRNLDGRRRDRTRLRVFEGIAAVLIVLLIVAAALGVVARQQAEIANKQRLIAVEQRDKALASQSRLLASLAILKTKEGDATDGMRIALEALPDTSAGIDRPYVPQAKMALDASWRAPRLIRVLEGHQHWVVRAAFSPDNARVITASEDETARLWDAVSGEELEVLHHPHKVENVEFSANGELALTISHDKKGWVWNAKSGYPRAEFDDTEEAHFNVDATRVLTMSEDKPPRLWDPVSGTQIAALAGHEGAVSSAVFSPDGTRVLTASADRTARLWDAASGRQTVVFEGHQARVSNAVFMPDGARVLTTSDDGTARLWDVASGAQIVVFEGHQASVSSAVISPDGKLVLTASADKTARLWNAGTGELLAILAGHESAVKLANFSSDGTRILTAARSDNVARLWDGATGKQVAALYGHANQVNGALFSPDSRLALTWAAHDNKARLWETVTGNQVALLGAHGAQLDDASFSPDGTRIVTSADDWLAILWDVASGKNTVVAGEKPSLSRDGKRILTVDDRRASGKLTVARLWDTASGKQVAALTGHGHPIETAVFNEEGTRILTIADDDKVARLWDAAGGQWIAELAADSTPVRTAIFSLGTSRILTTSDDREVRVWDAVTGKRLTVLTGHEKVVTSATFSDDGKLVLTGSKDQTARLWDTETGEQLAVLAGHQSAVETADFSPDGRRILTFTTDHVGRLWDAASGHQLAIAPDLAWVAFSPDGARVLAVGNFQMQLWDAETGAKVGALLDSDRPLRIATFSPDGARVLTVSEDNMVTLWDAHGGGPLATLPVGRYSVFKAIFSPDARHLVTIADGGPALLWDVVTGKKLAEMSDVSVVALASFSPNSNLFATTQKDGTIHVRESTSGEAVAALDTVTDGGSAYSIDFSSDGTLLFSQYPGNNTVRIWRLFPDTQALIDQAKAAIPMCLRPADRQRLFLDPEPPRWCITGVGHERERDSASWAGLWPYNGRAWKAWLTAKDRGETLPLPAAPDPSDAER